MKHELNAARPSSERSMSLGGSIVPSRLSPNLAGLDESLGVRLWRCEMAFLAALLLLLNLPLFFGEFSARFIFDHAAVRAGEWWRLLTHPFVHVSGYHLALDAAAFFLAYVELQHRSLSHRSLLLASSAAGGLLAALVASPLILTHGLCGLSGIAHGLAAVVSLELLQRSTDRLSRWTAALCLIGVVSKSAIEAVTGNVVFSSWHLGALGTPIAACHAGGVLGALVCWRLLAARQTEPIARPAHDAKAEAHLVNNFPGHAIRVVTRKALRLACAISLTARVRLNPGEASRMEDSCAGVRSQRESSRVVDPVCGARGATRPTILVHAGVD